MRAVVQRVTRASVTVDQTPVGSIGPGLCVLVGVTHTDTGAVAEKMAERLLKLRIFADADGKMNLSVADVGGEVLVISQFTLYGQTGKGNRPSYVEAARPELAEPLIEHLVNHLRSLGAGVAGGRFGAHMVVELVNDGPVTVSMELS